MARNKEGEEQAQIVELTEEQVKLSLQAQDEQAEKKGTDANPLNATHPFTWKGCNFWVVATWREYEILKKIFIVNEIYHSSWYSEKKI